MRSTAQGLTIDAHLVRKNLGDKNADDGALAADEAEHGETVCYDGRARHLTQIVNNAISIRISHAAGFQGYPDKIDRFGAGIA